MLCHTIGIGMSVSMNNTERTIQITDLTSPVSEDPGEVLFFWRSIKYII
jgi:hypothetical protein